MLNKCEWYGPAARWRDHVINTVQYKSTQHHQPRYRAWANCSFQSLQMVPITRSSTAAVLSYAQTIVRTLQPPLQASSSCAHTCKPNRPRPWPRFRKKPDVAARRKCSSAFWNPWFLAKVIILLIAIDLFTYFWVGVGLVRADQKLRFLTSIIGTGTWLGCYRFSPDLTTNDCGRNPTCWTASCNCRFHSKLSHCTAEARVPNPYFFRAQCTCTPGRSALERCFAPFGAHPPGRAGGLLKKLSYLEPIAQR